MRSLNRRSFLLRSAGLLAAPAVQQWEQERGAADPLPQPGWITGTRPVVDSTFNDATVKGIEQKLRCTCGCGLDIFTCRTTDFTCTYSPALHEEVVALLRSGNDSNAAVAALVAKYGEAVLLAPKASGFGIVGYALPGAAMLLAALALAWVVGRRSKRRGVAAPVAPAGQASPGSDEDLARLERELRELET